MGIIGIIKHSGKVLGIFSILKWIAVEFVLILIALLASIFWIPWTIGLIIIFLFIIIIIIQIFKIKKIISNFLSLENIEKAIKED